MTISCTDLKDFLDTIAGLVERGLGFHANGSTLEIRLTGAF